MTLTSDQYEEFIAALIEHIKEVHRDIRDIGCGRGNKIQGACGVRHQIDVSFVDRDFAQPTLVLIECKRQGKPIDLAQVKVLKATLDDILLSANTPNSVKAIMVATSGARSGAQTFADRYGIRIEHTPHGPNFTFKYEHWIQAGISLTATATLDAAPIVRRVCDSCRKRFVVSEGESSRCHECELLVV